MRLTVKSRVLVALVVLVPAACFLLWQLYGRSGEDVLRGSARDDVPHLRLTGPPLFVFGNLYLDGRSAWLAREFARGRAGLADESAPAAAETTVRVHREPFSQGAWLSALDEVQAVRRVEVESQAVESRVMAFYPGVPPRTMVLFISLSGFMRKVEGEGLIEVEDFLPPFDAPPPELDEVPELGPGRLLTRERWKRPLAMPTDICLVSQTIRDGEVYACIHEAWRNLGDATHAAVRLASCQYAVVGRDGGSILYIHSYYSGQGIPPFFEGIVERMTAAFYERLLPLLGNLVRTWEPTEKQRAWISALGWG